MYVRVQVLLGYFYLSSQTPSWPKGRARWGHIVHGEVESSAAAQVFAEDFRDFILAGATGLCQLDKLSYGTVPALDTSKLASDQEWDWVTLYDHAGQLYPTIDYSAPYWGWPRGWLSDAEHPLPPFLGLRYRRVPQVSFTGRQHYGYVRTIQCRYANFSGSWAEGFAPYVPVNQAAAHQYHVSDALSLSGFDSYHGGGVPRETVLYYRNGVLTSVPVTGYGEDVMTTTSRRFLL